MEPGSVNNPEDEHVQSFIIEQANQVSPQSGDWTTLIQNLRFTNSGKYVSGHVDSNQDLVQLLETYRTITGTSFTSSINIQQTIKTIDETQHQMRFMSPASRPRLFWQMNAGEPTISYDGVPFMTVGHGTELPCVRFGGRRKKVEQVSLPSGEVVPMDYRMKTGCEAKITIRRVLRYPCAQYNESTNQGIAAIRRNRKQILDDLVQRISAGSAKFQDRFYFIFPTPMAHSGHAVPEIDGPPPIAQQVADEIVTHLSNGVTSVSNLSERIRNFVLTTSSNPALHANDPMYCPSDFDIFRQVYWLYKLDQVVDQDSSSSIGGLLGIERALTQAAQQVVNQSVASAPINTNSSTHITTTSSSSDAVTNVYSVIMDDGTASRGESPLDHLSEHQITAEQEVELNSGENSAHLMEEPPMVSQIQIGISSSPISIPQSARVQLGGSGAQIGRIAKRSLIQGGILTPVKVAASKPITTSTSSYNYRSSPTAEASPQEDDSVSQAQIEVQNMLRIIENQTHACKNLSALNNLRRQLTELCGQFSVYLAGGSAADFGTPAVKRART